MRVLVVVAGGVASILDVILIVLMLLGDATGEVAIALLGDNVGDNTLLGLEVESHLLRLVLAAGVGKHWLALELAHRVGHTHGMHHAAVHVHLNGRRLEVHVVVGHLALAIEPQVVAAKEHNRVLRRELHHMVDIDCARLLEARSVAWSIQRVACHRIDSSARPSQWSPYLRSSHQIKRTGNKHTHCHAPQ